MTPQNASWHRGHLSSSCMLAAVLVAALNLMWSVTALSEASNSAFVQPEVSARASGAATRTWFGVTPATTDVGIMPERASRRAAATASYRGTGWLPHIARSTISPSNGMSMAVNSGKPPGIIIAGAPASGKGTQCNLIKERYGVVHLSTGMISACFYYFVRNIWFEYDRIRVLNDTWVQLSGSRKLTR